MATPKQLVEETARILNLSVATLTVHDRNLANAEPKPLRSVAGRGRAAAKVTALDASHLVIAAIASASVKDSAKTVHTYGELRCEGIGPIGVARYDDLISGSLSDGLAALIEAASKKEIRRRLGFSLRLTIYGPFPRAVLEWSIDGDSSSLDYVQPHAWPKRRAAQPEGDLETANSISEVTILHLGAVIGNLLR